MNINDIFNDNLKSIGQRLQEQRRRLREAQAQQENNQSTEQIAEISKQALGSYVKKSAFDSASKAIGLGAETDAEKIKKKQGDVMKRQKGIARATDRLVRKEGVAEGLPQILRKVVPGYAKREIDRKMDAEKFAETEMAECGEMPMQSDTESSMNISTNMNSNGDTNITVSASGEQAAALMAMLKMAGLGDGDKARSMAIPAEEVAMEEEYANEPEEEVQTVDAIIHQGNDLHREKTQYADKPKSGDNPMATMEQVNPLDSLGSKLMQAYESIKAKK